MVTKVLLTVQKKNSYEDMNPDIFNPSSFNEESGGALHPIKLIC